MSSHDEQANALFEAAQRDRKTFHVRYLGVIAPDVGREEALDAVEGLMSWAEARIAAGGN